MKPPTACSFLQNKAFFFPPPVDLPADAEPLPLSTPCWCLKTHDPVGPDGGDVSEESCGSRRTCYLPEVDL